MKSNFAIKISVFFAFAAFIVPSFAQATSERFEVSAWIPYWRDARGVANILPNLSSFTEVNPFMYTVKDNGELFANGALTDPHWKELQTKAKEQGIKYIPTVMWSDPDAMHDVLSDPEKRQEHIRSIIREVFVHNLDGIDIDYEAKYAKTRDAFSLFLKGLNDGMGYNKLIMCTIETRTPLDSRYSSPEAIPKDIEYANDFKEINKYCDRVRFMAYDQGRIDLKLNAERGHPYTPVADVAWVRKVITFAMTDIPKDKITIGVPTYGYEWDMFSGLNGDPTTRYNLLWSFNPTYGFDNAKRLGLTPTRNSAGELSISFPASQSLEVKPVPTATRVLVWSDAEAIKQKIDLAKELGVRGIAIFKIDDGQDPALWNVLAQYKDTKVEVPAGGGMNVPPGGMENITSADEPAPSGGQTGGGTTVSVIVPDINLQLGARSAEVKDLQKFLNAKGFTVSTAGGGSAGNETTYFGPATRAALIKYQKARAVAPAVGYFGPLTRATMKKEG
jgi:spore germination protein YaaH